MLLSALPPSDQDTPGYPTGLELNNIAARRLDLSWNPAPTTSQLSVFYVVAEKMSQDKNWTTDQQVCTG